MADEKPKTAAGYNQDHTLLCERVLVTLLRGFGPLKQTLRLIGGLVPRYLTPEQPPDVPPHAGTMDVDIVLNIQVLAEGDGYKALAQRLKDLGFKRAVNKEGKASSWRWERKIAEHQFVVVEFLRDEAEDIPAGSVSAVEDEKISALAIRYAGIVHEWYGECEVTAELLDDGGVPTETVRFADEVSFIILKALAFDQRNENKDAGDLIHVMRYAHEGDVSVVAEAFRKRMAEGKHVDAIQEALGVLNNRFCDGEKVEGFRRDGSVACVNFMLDASATTDERIREQRYVSALVTEFLRLVRQ